MNILHFGCPYHPYQGGSSVRLSNLVLKYVANSSLSLQLVTPVPSEDAIDDVPFSAVYRSSTVNSLLYSSDLYFFLKENKPDIVVLHNNRALLKWLLWYGFLFKAKTVVEIHSFREESKLRVWLNRFLYKFVDSFVVMSNSSASFLKKTYLVENVDVIYNGVSISLPRLADRSTDGGTVFGYVGSFHEWQGVVKIAEAANELGEEFWESNKLYLVGGGPAHDSVLEVLGEALLNHPNIVVTGWCSKEQAQEYIEQLDYLLAPRPSTLATDTVVPLKVFESMSYGKPLIISPVNGLTELLGSDAAVIMQDNSIKSLVKAFKDASAKPNYESMVRVLQEKRKTVSDWQGSANKYVDLFERLVRS